MIRSDSLCVTSTQAIFFCHPSNTKFHHIGG
nr:MAG TPA: hypothetical protein [Caudoviricetes sp.]